MVSNVTLTSKGIAPYKYNGGKLANTTLYTLDWLELTTKIKQKGISELLNSSGLLTAKMGETGSKHYRNSAKIYMAGLPVATLFFTPRSNVLNKDYAQIKLENRTFTASNTGWWWVVLQNIETITKMEYVSVTRLDIAADVNTKVNLDLVTDIDASIRLGKIRFSNNIKEYTSYSHHKDGKLTTKQIKFGSNKSEKSFKIYNKTEEIKESKKVYIQDLHRAVFKTNQLNVVRFEVTLRSKQNATIAANNGQKSIKEYIYGLIEEKELASTFNSLYQAHYTLRVNAQGKEFSKMEQIDFKMNSWANLAKVKAKTEETEMKGEEATKVRRDCMTAKYIIQRMAIGSRTKAGYGMLSEVLEYAPVLEKVRKRMGYWLEEKKDKLTADAYSVIDSIVTMIEDENKAMA